MRRPAPPPTQFEHFQSIVLFSCVTIFFLAVMGVTLCAATGTCSGAGSSNSYFNVNRCISIFSENVPVCSTAGVIILSFVSFFGGLGIVVSMYLMYTAFGPLMSKFDAIEKVYETHPIYVFFGLLISCCSLGLYYFVTLLSVSSNVLFAGLLVAGIFTGIVGGATRIILRDSAGQWRFLKPR